jgi:hypothetical protein
MFLAFLGLIVGLFFIKPLPSPIIASYLGSLLLLEFLAGACVSQFRSHAQKIRQLEDEIAKLRGR